MDPNVRIEFTDGLTFNNGVLPLSFANNERKLLAPFRYAYEIQIHGDAALLVYQILPAPQVPFTPTRAAIPIARTPIYCPPGSRLDIENVAGAPTTATVTIRPVRLYDME